MGYRGKWGTYLGLSRERLSKRPQEHSQRRWSLRVAVVCVVIIVIFFAVAFPFILGGLFSKEDIGSYAPSVREEKGKPHHDFGNRRSHSSQTVTA